MFEIFLFSKGREGAKSAEIVWSHRYPSMQMNQGQNPISQKSIPAVKAKPRLIFMIKRKCQAKSKLLQVGINLAQFNTVKVQMLLKITWESLIGTLFSRKAMAGRGPKANRGSWPMCQFPAEAMRWLIVSRAIFGESDSISIPTRPWCILITAAEAKSRS